MEAESGCGGDGYGNGRRRLKSLQNRPSLQEKSNIFFIRSRPGGGLRGVVGFAPASVDENLDHLSPWRWV
jgi:hypothetical protein